MHFLMVLLKLSQCHHKMESLLTLIRIILGGIDLHPEF